MLDLFSGIGGFSLGLERAGMQTVAFCEIEPYARAVLRKHWPDVRIYDDIRTLSGQRLADDGIGVDVICGGFPCQDISSAGYKAGLAGERSGLWVEFARLIREVRPRYVIVENVAALLGRGLERVLGDLAALGYDAEWHCIPAAALSAPHGRYRVWIVAYPNGDSEPDRPFDDETCGLPPSGRDDFANAKRGERPLGWLLEGVRRCWEPVAGNATWAVEDSPMGMGVANGIPARLDRLRCLGNAVVPQIPEIIGRAIMRVNHD